MSQVVATGMSSEKPDERSNVGLSLPDQQNGEKQTVRTSQVREKKGRAGNYMAF
jgi:hypothetical protein